MSLVLWGGQISWPLQRDQGRPMLQRLRGHLWSGSMPMVRLSSTQEVGDDPFFD